MSFVICPICLESLHLNHEDQSAIPCGHVYHDSCIQRWIGRGENNCPQCRFSFRRRDILRLHFSTADNGSLVCELREELRATKERLKDAEASCAMVLEQSVAEQSKLKEMLRRAQMGLRQEFQVNSADISGLKSHHRVQMLREELRKTKNRLKEAEASCATVLEQSVAHQSQLTETLRQAQANAALLLEQSVEQQTRLQQSLSQTQSTATTVLEQSAAEQSRLQERLRQSQTSAASLLERSVAEQSRLQESLRETQRRAAAVLDQSVSEQSRLEEMLRREQAKSS